MDDVFFNTRNLQHNILFEHIGYLSSRALSESVSFASYNIRYCARLALQGHQFFEQTI